MKFEKGLQPGNDANFFHVLPRERFPVDISGVSQKGLVLETPHILAAGCTIEVLLGELPKRATVVRAAEGRYFCDFVVPLRYQDAERVNAGPTTATRLS